MQEIISLRPYQLDAIEALRNGIRGGARKQVLVAPTGAGKSVVAASLIQSAVDKGSKAWFLVDRINLVDQTSAVLSKYGIDHGIVQGQHNHHDPSKQVHVVSAQTLARRTLDDTPDLIVFDEAHVVYRSISDLIDRTGKAKVVGLTATPFTAGMAEMWEGLVNTTTTNKLIGEKFLKPLKIRACVAPDMKGAKKNIAGEWDEEEAGQRGVTIIGDVVKTWEEETRKHFGGPVKTIVFSPSVAHGEELCRRFAEAGHNFQQLSYKDGSDKDRRDKIEEFRRPDSVITGLVSCAVLQRGFDVPDCRVGISCRPYRKSFSSHIQEMGRVMRSSPGQDYGLWLCHSGNAVNFADETSDLFENGCGELSKAAKKDAVVREKKENEKKERFCPQCGYEIKGLTCVSCGWERPKANSIEHKEGVMMDLDLSGKKLFTARAGLRAGFLTEAEEVWNAALAYANENTRKGEEAARKWATGIFRSVYDDWPARSWPSKPDPSRVSQNQYSFIHREVQRYRKQLKKGGK